MEKLGAVRETWAVRGSFAMLRMALPPKSNQEQEPIESEGKGGGRSGDVGRYVQG